WGSRPAAASVLPPTPSRCWTPVRPGSACQAPEPCSTGSAGTRRPDPSEVGKAGIVVTGGDGGVLGREVAHHTGIGHLHTVGVNTQREVFGLVGGEVVQR